MDLTTLCHVALAESSEMTKTSILTFSVSIIKALILIGATTASNVSFADGDPNAAKIVEQWVLASLQASDFHIDWTIENEAITASGEVADSFEIREACDYSWPDVMTIDIEAVAKGGRHDFARAAQFDRTVQLDTTGQYSEIWKRTANNRSLGQNMTLRDLIRAESHRAPHLIGLWLSDHPDAINDASMEADGAASLIIPELGIRFFVQSIHGQDAFAVNKIQAIDSDLVPVLWWEYDDFRPITNSKLFTGYFRIQCSPVNGEYYESPPSRIQRAALVSRESSILQSNTTRLTHESSGVSGSNQTIEPKAKEAVRMSLSWLPNALFIFGACGLTAGLIWMLRR